LSDFDLEVLDGLHTFYNKPMELLIIAAPALVSLSLCPVALYLYNPLVTIFWPFPKFTAQPNINDAIACFLAPAGLVYATSFGFAFQSALAKQSEIVRKLSHEVGMLDQIVTLTAKLSLPKKMQLEIYRAIKAEAMFMGLQLQRKQPTDFINKPKENVKVRIWKIVDILKSIKSRNEFDGHVNQVMVREIIAHIMCLNSICSDRLGILHVRIHWLKWTFLETLGFFSFFGVLLLDTKSQSMNLAMCIITVFSISLLCYVVSDFDSPFSGFFRIELDVLLDVVDRIAGTFNHANMGEEVHWTYPDIAVNGCVGCFSK
ncbi:uncharacterized protein LOC135483036, partial [Lineus longissimus]|uniref:uncharacterized protein LOC135483036 n=1 Tax=Lineus longissimus TaxID=88925 RepID=UPI00315C89ED